jgi:hypothetical protein
VQLQLLEGLDDGVEVDGAKGWDGTENLLQPPSMVTVKSRLPKRPGALGAEAPVWLAIHGLLESTKCAKHPYLVHQLSVFRTAD